MIVKGAVDVLLNRTDWVEMKGETHEITEETRRVIEEQNQKYSREGLRVLASDIYRNDRNDGSAERRVKSCCRRV